MAPIKEWFGLYNVMFNWFEERYGYEALEEYWEFIASKCFDEVVEKFKKEGLEGIKEYFEDTFELDGGIYSTEIDNDSLYINVEKCPDYEFMKSSENPYFQPIKSYCKHHEVINRYLAQESGHTFCLSECDDKGKCKWVFKREVKQKI